jgi:hypothetical protein
LPGKVCFAWAVGEIISTCSLYLQHGNLTCRLPRPEDTVRFSWEKVRLIGKDSALYRVNQGICGKNL